MVHHHPLHRTNTIILTDAFLHAPQAKELEATCASTMMAAPDVSGLLVEMSQV